MADVKEKTLVELAAETAPAKPKTVEEILAEQGVELPEKGKFARETVAESREPHHNAWQAKAMQAFPGFWCERVEIRGVSQDYPYQKVDNSMSQGRVILYNPETDKTHVGMKQGKEHFELVGHPNFCLMGIPLEQYAKERQELHRLTNQPLAPSAPSAISTPFEKDVKVLDKQTIDQYFDR